MTPRTLTATEHSYIARTSEVQGGEPVIKGTRFPVRSVVTYVLKEGKTPEELMTVFPRLHLAEIYDALAFYYGHREEMERLISEQHEEKWMPKKHRHL